MERMWSSKVKKTTKRIRQNVCKKGKIGLRILVALIFTIFFVIPIVLTICNSFMTETEITANYGKVFETGDTGGHKFISEKVNLKFIPDKVSFSQYTTVLLKSPKYLLKFWNSVLYVVPIVLMQIMIASLAAYGFARFRGKKREILFFIYVIITLMPYQVTLVPNYLVADWLNILNSRWAILLPGFFSPFSVYLLTKYMRRISPGIIEAAKVDGAGEWKIFTKICMPMCKSAVFSVGILVFIDYWNMVEQPLILLKDQEKYPLSIFLSQINKGEIGLAFAVAVIYMIPSLLVFLYGEEYLVDGIASQGGLKG